MIETTIPEPKRRSEQYIFSSDIVKAWLMEP